jgi:2-C-methyl-D-erythritol 2,4-cyclodiphosphate synthase
MRIGSSIDIHRLEKGLDLYLGGVKIDHTKGLVGHSDADCLLHAISEALIGAMGLGDLGMHFPDTDPDLKGIDSKVILAKVRDLLKKNGYMISNIDSLVLCERPKLAPHKEQMKQNIASILQIRENQVNVKATRGEKLGFIGAEEGIVAEATVLIYKNQMIPAD